MSDSPCKASRKPTACDQNTTAAAFDSGAPLSEEDFRRLSEESWIDRETAIAAGLKRFDSFSGAELVGRTDGGKADYSGIAFPYFLPGAMQPHTYRLRRDNPEYEIGKDGRPKPFRKYLTAPGTRNRVYFPPGVTNEDLRNAELPIVFTEGEKKSLSLGRLSRCAPAPERFLVLGIPGVWSWRGVTGKTSDANGKRVDVVGVISDMDLVVWTQRLVLLAFDKDARANENVRIALAALAKELKKRGAIVKFLHIPEEVNANGIDELLAMWGPDRVLDLIEAGFESTQPIQSQYYAQGGGLWRNASTREGVAPVQLTNFTATIARAVVEDDGAEKRRRFEIEAAVPSGKTHRFTISASDFNFMSWALDKIGPEAIVYPNQKEHARTAIQSLSRGVAEEVVFTHTGWREVDGRWIYLHAGGGIGEKGNVEGVSVRLSGALSHYHLSLPSTGEEAGAIRASLELLGLAEAIMYPLLAAVYRSAIKECDFVVHLVGPSGVFKTAIAALLQQHFGSCMDERNLPGSWSSTGNALEMLAYSVKDALLVVDDFAPKGSSHKVQRLHGVAERLIRAAGNNSGRGRLTPDGDLRECKPPRGLVLSTGEDVPEGYSVRARLLTVEVTKGTVDVALLTKVQRCGRSGQLSQSMAGFIRWLARDYSARREAFEEQISTLRSQLGTAAHTRTPVLQANLQAAFELFLTYALDAGAINQYECCELNEACRAALNACVMAQEEVQAAAEPTAVYFSLLKTALSTKRAHIADLGGGPPKEAERWGWKKRPGNVGGEWEAGGTCIGWIDGDNLYLESNAAFYMAQEIGRSVGESVAIAPATLNKRLADNKLLLNWEKNRTTYKIRKAIGGSTLNVLHLSLSKFAGTEQ